MVLSDFVLLSFFAVGLSLFSQIINKFLIDEKLVENIKNEMKDLNSKLKNVDPNSKDFETIQNRQIELNTQLMKMQLKPMFFTFLPFILVFQVMASMFAYAPIDLNSTLNINIQGTGDIYSECLNISAHVNNTFSQEAKVSNTECILNLNNINKTINMGERKIIKFETQHLSATIIPEKKIYIHLPFNLPLIGNKFGWLGTYIILSLISTMISTPILKKISFKK